MSLPNLVLIFGTVQIAAMVVLFVMRVLTADSAYTTRPVLVRAYPSRRPSGVAKKR